MNELRTGICEFCGNPRQVVVDMDATQAEANEQATQECGCFLATEKRKKELQRNECIKNIKELLEEEFPEIADIFLGSVGYIQEDVIRSISADTGMGKKAKLQRTKDGIKVELAESRKSEKTA